MDRETLKKKFWFQCVDMTLKKGGSKAKKLMKIPNYLFLKRLYEKCGGSWVGLSEGSSKDWDTLRRVTRFYVKHLKDKVDDES